MLQEPEEVAMKRKRTRETLRVLQQAFRVSDSCLYGGLKGYKFVHTYTTTSFIHIRSALAYGI